MIGEPKATCQVWLGAVGADPANGTSLVLLRQLQSWWAGMVKVDGWHPPSHHWIVVQYGPWPRKIPSAILIHIGLKLIQHDPTTNRLQFILVDSGRNLDRPPVYIYISKNATEPRHNRCQIQGSDCSDVADFTHAAGVVNVAICRLETSKVYQHLSTSVNICQHFQQFIQLSSNFHPFSHFSPVFLQFPWCSWFTQPCSAS